jgi:putative transposase
MKKAKFTESQTVNILKEAGISLEALSRPHGFCKATFHKWEAKYDGTDVSVLKRLKELEEENRLLKQMHEGLSLEHETSKDIVEKKTIRPGARRELAKYAIDEKGRQTCIGGNF